MNFFPQLKLVNFLQDRMDFVYFIKPNKLRLFKVEHIIYVIMGFHMQIRLCVYTLQRDFECQI